MLYDVLMGKEHSQNDAHVDGDAERGGQQRFAEEATEVEAGGGLVKSEANAQPGAGEAAYRRQAHRYRVAHLLGAGERSEAINDEEGEGEEVAERDPACTERYHLHGLSVHVVSRHDVDHQHAAPHHDQPAHPEYHQLAAVACWNITMIRLFGLEKAIGKQKVIKLVLICKEVRQKTT